MKERYKTNNNMVEILKILYELIRTSVNRKRKKNETNYVNYVSIVLDLVIYNLVYASLYFIEHSIEKFKYIVIFSDR